MRHRSFVVPRHATTTPFAYEFARPRLGGARRETLDFELVAEPHVALDRDAPKRRRPVR